MSEHLVLPVLLPLAFLALIFVGVSCVGCTDQVVGMLRRLVHSREKAPARHPSAPVS